MELVWSPAAVDDLRDAVDYIDVLPFLEIELLVIAFLDGPDIVENRVEFRAIVNDVSGAGYLFAGIPSLGGFDPVQTGNYVQAGFVHAVVGNAVERPWRNVPDGGHRGVGGDREAPAVFKVHVESSVEIVVPVAQAPAVPRLGLEMSHVLQPILRPVAGKEVLPRGKVLADREGPADARLARSRRAGRALFDFVLICRIGRRLGLLRVARRLRRPCHPRCGR